MRVVAALDLGEAPVVRAIRLLDSVIFIIGHEIDVDTARRIRCGRLKELASPSDAGLILSGLTPARMRIHNEMSVAIRPRRGVRGYARHGTADVGEQATRIA